MFELTDPHGDTVHARPVRTLSGPGVALGINGGVPAYIPLGRVEEVVAGIRDTARQAAARTTGPQALDPVHILGIATEDDRAPEAEDTCRVVEVGGETIRVRGAGEMSDESRAALGEVIDAAKRKYAAEHPDVPPRDRAVILSEEAEHLRTVLYRAVYDDAGQHAADGVARAAGELRRRARALRELAAEPQQDGAAQ